MPLCNVDSLTGDPEEPCESVGWSVGAPPAEPLMESARGTLPADCCWERWGIVSGLQQCHSAVLVIASLSKGCIGSYEGGSMNVRRMLPPQPSSQRPIRLARLAHGIVAGVEVLALFELVLEKVFLVGEFSVEAEELLLFLSELL